MPVPPAMPISVAIESLDTLAPAANGCASKAHYNPFVSHAFFTAVEKSNSACARTGWGPRHLIAKSEGRIVGVVPCYLKSHSQGEYVFDRGWADAYERAGGQYYPKLQASVPFTPATGPRLLIRDGVDVERVGAALAGGLVGALRGHRRIVRPCHFRARERMAISRRARLPAAHRPAVSFPQ